MQQERWISYVFRYKNNTRCETAGFIKVCRIASGYRVISPNRDVQEIKGDTARIQLGVRMYKKTSCRCLVYLIYRPEGCMEPRVKFLEEMNFKPEERDMIAKRFELSWDNPLGDGMLFDNYDGLFFVCDDGEILVGMWDEYPFNIEQIKLDGGKNNEECEESFEEHHKEEHEVKSENPVSDSNASNSVSWEGEIDIDSVCQEMLSSKPKLHMSEDSQLLECVKIVPQDLGRLSMGNWKLGINSFLSHGYYHYRYIMFGRIKFERRELYVIGVPGIYTNKEKYLANMFGFSVFIPVKKTKLLTGNFGYWVLEMSRQ